MGQCFLVSCFLGNLLIPEIVGGFLVESAGDDSNLDGVFAAYEAHSVEAKIVTEVHNL
jgi:hypothetical protein